VHLERHLVQRDERLARHAHGAVEQPHHLGRAQHRGRSLGVVQCQVPVEVGRAAGMEDCGYMARVAAASVAAVPKRLTAASRASSSTLVATRVAGGRRDAAEARCRSSARRSRRTRAFTEAASVADETVTEPPPFVEPPPTPSWLMGAGSPGLGDADPPCRR